MTTSVLLDKKHGKQTRFITRKCKYCGRIFFKTHNRQEYCGKKCYTFSRKEQKAFYQQKRRLLIKNGELISNENKELGTTFLSPHPNMDFIREYKIIQKELKRIGVKIT